MAYFDELLQRAITVRNNRAPASNTADLVGGVLVGIVTALQMLLDDKQDELTFDTAPTADSPNPVTSDGIYQALQAIDLSACEKIVNKVTSINAQSTDVQYPTAKLLYDSLQALSGIYAAIQHTHAIADIINLQTELDARQLVSNLVTAITAQSTDVQYPSAKLLYDQLQGLAAVYAPKVHTHPFVDIERPANVASVNAQGYTITTAYYSHVLTITADATLHLPTMQSGAAIILRLTIIQDATGGRAVTFDGGAALVFNPYQTDLSLGQANYRCWVVLWFDGVNWAWLASPYVLRAESQFAYTIDGTTGGQYVTITINGTTMQIQATSGVWQYGYNNPINTIAFTGDTGVLNVDFTNSDGLANITTLADAFKNCAALVAVDFTGCDLSNVATAADCFAGCTSLAALTIQTGTWKPDIDLSACAAFTKAAMLAVIDGLYTYASGTHTVTFNSTAWDALSQADQQAVFDAAALKGWTTNAVAVSYVVRGTSSNVNGIETFRIQFIQDNAQTPDVAETITVNVDANGDWSFEYNGKKICSLQQTFKNKTTITSIDFSAADDFSMLYYAQEAFSGCTNLTTAIFANQTFENVTNCYDLFFRCSSLTSLDLSKATFANATNARRLLCITGLTSINLPLATFSHATNVEFLVSDNYSALTISLPEATFASATLFGGIFYNCNNATSISAPKAIFGLGNSTDYNTSYGFAQNCSKLQSINLSSATFASVTSTQVMFKGCTLLSSIDLSSATFANVTDASQMFYGCSSLATITWPNMNMNNLQTVGGVRVGMFCNCTSLTNAAIAPFANLTMPNLETSANMFYGCSSLTKIDLKSAILGNVTTCYSMFGACTNVVEIDLSAATLSKVNDSNINNYPIFQNCTSLTTLITTQQNTAISPTSQPNRGPMNVSYSPLTYQSMLNVANWLSDLTGYTAHTCIFKTSAWNALTAAEQTNIDTILSGKNWTRVLA